MSSTPPIEMTLEEYWAWMDSQPKTPITPKRQGATKAKVEIDWLARLLDQIQDRGLPMPQKEYQFHAERRWRFDFHWKHIGKLLAVEVEGAIFGRPVVCHQCGQQVKRQVNGKWVVVREGGRHNTGVGIEGDMEKYNEAALYGWRVIRVTSTMIRDGRAIDWIERALL